MLMAGDWEKEMIVISRVTALCIHVYDLVQASLLFLDVIVIYAINCVCSNER